MGCPPEYKAVETPFSFNWGLSSHGATFTVKTSTIDYAYNLVPYGKTGKDFIDQLAEHINVWNKGVEGQHVSLKAATVLMAVGLQKPSRASKAKDHQECLKKRLILWKEGEIGRLVCEGRSIQKRLTKVRKSDQPNKAKKFATLVMEGKINAALRYLNDEDCEGALPLSDEVMSQLVDKHPQAQEAKMGSLVYGSVDKVPDVLYQQINAEMVREAALRTKGSGGLSGVAANGFKRMLACKSFKKSSTNLCDYIAVLARRLCTEFIETRPNEPILSNRLIPLDKDNGEVDWCRGGDPEDKWKMCDGSGEAGCY